MAEKPRAVFDVCPTPPLIWSEFAVHNLITLARAGIPAEMVSMPLAGAASPVTLLGFDRPTCSRKPGGDRDPPGGATGCSHCMGRCAGHLRHAQRWNTLRRHRDGHDQCCLCPGRESIEPADAWLSGRQRFQSWSMRNPGWKAAQQPCWVRWLAST